MSSSILCSRKLVGRLRKPTFKSQNERRAQEEVLQSNALKIDELENIINSNNSKLLICKENTDLKTKLNLLNVINNDRVATQVIESDEGSNPNEDSRETCSKIQANNLKIDTNLLKIDLEYDDKNKISPGISEVELSPITNLPNTTKGVQTISSKSLKRDEYPKSNLRVCNENLQNGLCSPIRLKNILSDKLIEEEKCMNRENENASKKPKPYRHMNSFNSPQKVKYLSISIAESRQKKNEIPNAYNIKSPSKYSKNKRVSVASPRNLKLDLLMNSKTQQIQEENVQVEYESKKKLYELNSISINNINKELTNPQDKLAKKLHNIHHSKAISFTSSLKIMNSNFRCDNNNYYNISNGDYDRSKQTTCNKQYKNCSAYSNDYNLKFK